jgi:hypothetical protein
VIDRLGLIISELIDGEEVGIMSSFMHSFIITRAGTLHDQDTVVLCANKT